MNKIFKNIIKSEQLSVKNKIKSLLYYFSRKRWAQKSWTDRHQKVFAQHRSYDRPCPADIESEHQKKWSVFRPNIDMSTLRICKNISGNADSRIIPEDVFVSDIEPTLITDDSGQFLSHKSFYNRWFPDGIFPHDYFHCINGQYLDSNLNRISFDELTEQAPQISYPVVVKPNWHSYGGKKVFFAENAEKLISLCKLSKDFVVQEQLEQHEFFSKYHPAGINTIKVYVYKSIKDNAPHILNMALRMGRNGSLDNESSGGIHTMINSDGFLNEYAVDKYGQIYEKHPDTGFSFDDKIPAHKELKELALRVSEQVYFNKIIGLDMCYDKSGRWRVIEVNTKGHTIRFSQYGGQPFLGEFTDEIIEYCKKNHWTLNTNL